ncbi:hypothetical protein SAMN02927900_01676 [Rhizobium mongolense subsp. loessense]|uniref:Uncharacterized protein n=1 Tax=Rhizobium mongolense subsp. loessense TaxID=158890 RepID=A0A1G4QPN0_9HYPH|nr:hypothetical protein SAMN02927900_01676 [Rhizobium mongolense subsp. loessense]
MTFEHVDARHRADRRAISNLGSRQVTQKPPSLNLLRQAAEASFLETDHASCTVVADRGSTPNGGAKRVEGGRLQAESAVLQPSAILLSAEVCPGMVAHPPASMNWRFL